MNKNIKTALIIGGVIVVLLIIMPLVAGMLGFGYGFGMMGPWMMGGFGWAGVFWLILTAIFWGLVIWGIVALVRGVWTGSAGSSSQSESALEILKKRYARGEINKQEYEERKKDLT